MAKSIGSLSPMFTTDGDGVFYPANKDATACCAILSRMRLKHADIMQLKGMGHNPRLINGDQIKGIDIWA